MILYAQFDLSDADAIDEVGIPDRALVRQNVERFLWTTYQKVQECANHGAIVVAMDRVPVNVADVWKHAKLI